MRWARAQHDDGWGSDKGTDGGKGIGQRGRGVENSGVGYDPQELTDAWPRYRPGLRAVRQPIQQHSGLRVKRKSGPMRIDEDVGIDSDQSRPSMTS